MNKIHIQPFFHEPTFTVTYVVTDLASHSSAVIDPVMDFDAPSGRLSTHTADKIVRYLDENDYSLEWILETHAHADHVSAARYLKKKRGGEIGIGEHITRVQDTFKDVFHLEPEFACDGSQFDQLFADGEVVKLGHIDIHVLHTPGHTPACVSYRIEDAVFVGDTLFMPDFGTARTDFPNGSAKTLYRSIQRILALPGNTKVYVGHDYKAKGRDEYAWQTTVIEQLRSNIHMQQGTSEADFVAMREARDATLPVPKLLLPSIQINIRAGDMPPAEDNGVHYLKLPLNVL